MQGLLTVVWVRGYLQGAGMTQKQLSHGKARTEASFRALPCTAAAALERGRLLLSAVVFSLVFALEGSLRLKFLTFQTCDFLFTF